LGRLFAQVLVMIGMTFYLLFFVNEIYDDRADSNEDGRITRDEVQEVTLVCSVSFFSSASSPIFGPLLFICCFSPTLAGTHPFIILEGCPNLVTNKGHY